MTTATTVLMIAISVLVCYIFAGVVTELLIASLASILPSRRKRSTWWRYVLFGFIGIFSLACPVAALLFHSVLIWALIVQCMNGVCFGATAIAFLQKRLPRAASD